ncbi:hypothetical protein [Sphingobacterium siyangense]|uniref:Uncharacterized protein n=1 Tax=Sphingobacterium siyangense TaxID=459529 RepID=A0A562MQP0_9SPHI|nr:hypothetical protein [Sphingobacterium siyangense]TWI22160.1 hypothetical protein IQ31_01565 [Sphingobacterium siyangense]
MNKTRKNKHNYNDAVIEELRRKYGFHKNYIIMSVRGDRVGTFPTKIKDEYHQLDRASKAAIQKKISEL